MHRSASMHRTADELLLLIAPHLIDSQGMARKLEVELLPKYDPLLSKKELMPRWRMGDRAVHIIPIILLLCIFILWFFSHPVSHGSKHDTRLAEQGDTKIASDSSNLLSTVPKRIKYPDLSRHTENHRAARHLENSLNDPSPT